MSLTFIIDYFLLLKKNTTKGKRQPTCQYTGVCLSIYPPPDPYPSTLLIDFVVLKINVLYWVIFVGGELRL